PECPASHLRQLELGRSVRGCAARMLRADTSPLFQFIARSPVPVYLSASSLPVAFANLIVVRTAAMSGFHISPSDPDLPPRKKDKFPTLVRLYRIKPSLS